jgi:hypothetical protein
MREGDGSLTLLVQMQEVRHVDSRDYVAGSRHLRQDSLRCMVTHHIDSTIEEVSSRQGACSVLGSEPDTVHSLLLFQALL